MSTRLPQFASLLSSIIQNRPLCHQLSTKPAVLFRNAFPRNQRRFASSGCGKCDDCDDSDGKRDAGKSKSGKRCGDDDDHVNLPRFCSTKRPIDEEHIPEECPKDNCGDICNYFEEYRKKMSCIEDVPDIPPMHPFTGKCFRPYFPCRGKPTPCNPCDIALERDQRLEEIEKPMYCKCIVTCPKIKWKCKIRDLKWKPFIVVLKDERLRKKPKIKYIKGKRTEPKQPPKKYYDAL